MPEGRRNVWLTPQQARRLGRACAPGCVRSGGGWLCYGTTPPTP